jgi:NAD(P)-dependent dehydrogenase (short-subunit alcohol dehydrogenase family)
VKFIPDLLAGRRVACVGGGGAANPELFEALGASTRSLHGKLLFDPDDERAVVWAREHAPLHALVCDTRAEFGAGGPERLRAAMDLAWRAARAVATGAMIEAAQPARLIFVGPALSAGPFAPAVRAALENLSRSLSVEWARYALTAVSLAPGPDTGDDELAEVVAFLISDGGGYLSGCQIELGAVATEALIHRS